MEDDGWGRDGYCAAASSRSWGRWHRGAESVCYFGVGGWREADCGRHYWMELVTSVLDNFYLENRWSGLVVCFVGFLYVGEAWHPSGGDFDQSLRFSFESLRCEMFGFFRLQDSKMSLLIHAPYWHRTPGRFRDRHPATFTCSKSSHCRLTP